MAGELGEAVTATVPVRVADVGGWTDTWFGSPGQVCHLAVGPGVEVTAVVVAAGEAPVIDDPLLAAAVGAVLEGPGAVLAAGCGVRLDIRSAVPPGASLGTSGAVLVGIVAALDALVAGGRRSPDEVARLAHHAETVLAGREAGVQDQWAAATGGANLLEVGPYPEVRRRALRVPAEAWADLGERLVTVVFGAHDSSEVHRQVIDALVTCSGVEHHLAREALRSLSRSALDAARALEAGDLSGWGAALVASVDAQAALHPSLVGPAHRRAIDVAAAAGATAWKVNGAGGDGGSLIVLASPGGTDRVAAALGDADAGWEVLRLRPSSAGVTVTRRGPQPPSGG